jgi:hypothetical protein
MVWLTPLENTDSEDVTLVTAMSGSPITETMAFVRVVSGTLGKYTVAKLMISVYLSLSGTYFTYKPSDSSS